MLLDVCVSWGSTIPNPDTPQMPFLRKLKMLSFPSAARAGFIYRLKKKKGWVPQGGANERARRQAKI